MSWLLKSRIRVLLIAFLILLILDVGRSLYGRIGYDKPVSAWKEAPYQKMIWPPGKGIASTTPLGRKVYIQHCAVCHGPDGKGNGPAAPSMIPRPRDFTSGIYKYQTTTPGSPPSSSDLLKVIYGGLRASAMPYWADVLKDNEIQAVLEYITSLSPEMKKKTPVNMVIPPRPRADAGSLARGKRLYSTKGCNTCHGDDLRGGKKLADSFGYPVFSRDLAAPWSYRGGDTPQDIWLRITTGLAPSPMPSFITTMTDQERWDVTNYLISKFRKAPWEAGGVLNGPGFYKDSVNRGAYIIHSSMCGMCHTQISEDLIYSGDKYYLAGGTGIDVYPNGSFVSKNLTPDAETGLGRSSRVDIVNAIRDGRSQGLRVLNFTAMPWPYFHSYEDQDAIAVADYLKSLPPVLNQIPQPLRYGFVETTNMKLLGGNPVAGSPSSIVFKAGSFGYFEPVERGPDWPQRVMINAQIIVIIIMLPLFIMAGPWWKRFPHTIGGWLSTALISVVLGTMFFTGWVLYRLPEVIYIPPETVSKALQNDLYEPQAADLKTPEELNLAKRGKYLYTVTSCLYCHGEDGSGGTKLSHKKTFGSIWSRNLTSDKATGLGDWSDAQISRAIRSGVSKDGRSLHWQGMLWDHFSNLDEEDTRAIIKYLRVLPAVQNDLPTPGGPIEEDCEDFTILLQGDLEPGCH